MSESAGAECGPRAMSYTPGPPSLTRNATADPSTTNGNASSGAVMRSIFVGLIFRCCAKCSIEFDIDSTAVNLEYLAASSHG